MFHPSLGVLHSDHCQLYFVCCLIDDLCLCQPCYAAFDFFSLKSPNNQLLINISSFCRLGELVGKTRDDVRLTLMFKALSRGEVSHVLDICRLVQLVNSNACYFCCLFNRPYSRYPPSLPSLKD